MNQPSIKFTIKRPFSQSFKYLAILFVGVTFLALIVPFKPSMPIVGLDPSWAFAMNQAVAQSLVLGKDIVFTFGPYSGLFTRAYHPATDRLVMGASIYFAACFILVLAGLRPLRGQIPILLFTTLAMFTFGEQSALHFIYPILIAVFIATRISGNLTDGRLIFPRLSSDYLLAVLLTPLGLLPLVKGSFLPISIVTVVFTTILFGYYKKYLWAGLACLIPTVSASFFWVASGQKVTDLPGFFAALVPITSGYTEALAKNGNIAEVFAYIFGVFLVIFAIACEKSLAIPLRIYVAGCYLFFFFNVFKAGFVRHDAHAILAAISLVLASVVLNFILKKRLAYACMLVSILVNLFINHGYPVDYLDSPEKLYRSAWTGLTQRLTDKSAIRREYKDSLSKIRKAEPLPRFTGNTDIYSTHQAALFASGNIWNPRPVFQSYSAYTSQLGQLNEQHLRTSKAPDNIVFQIETIDKRFPSLDDGWSWPALLDNYNISRLDGNFIYLKKRNRLAAQSDFTILDTKKHQLGDVVKIPETSDLLFAEINLQQTILGSLFATAYKPTQLWITVNLQNGQTLKYRVIANMMQNGFLISPLTRKNWEFALLAAGRKPAITAYQVASFSLDTLEETYFSTWRPSYQLILKSYQRKSAPQDPFSVLAPTSDTIPEGFTLSDTIRNQGNLSINGLRANPAKQQVSDTLVVEGIVAISGKIKLPLDQFFITLRNADGLIRYGKGMPVVQRSTNYSNKKMNYSGVISLRDVSNLEGDWTLGIAIAHQGKLWPCQKFAVPISIGR